MIEHPNGSDGWLPAEQPVIKQEESEAVHPTSKRKKVMRTHSSQQQESPVGPLVNGNDGTTQAVDDKASLDLKNRAVSANDNLTQKQRSRIAKSEGQS
jgi:hypothetical protein